MSISNSGSGGFFALYFNKQTEKLEDLREDHTSESLGSMALIPGPGRVDKKIATSSDILERLKITLLQVKMKYP